MNEATILCSGVTKNYGKTAALKGIDLSTTPGVTGLLGPNGAGKTTLLRIVATVMSCDSGTIEILGSDPTRAEGRLSIRRRLGYMPQEPGYHLGFSAFDFVDYVAILKEWSERRSRHEEVRRVLDLVGLSSVMHKKIRQLSGGMRRRVGIAQALLGSPELLVLDEPTAGLDPEQRLRFRELLGTQAQHSTVLLSTHQTDDVAALCQRVLVMLHGEIRFDGTPAGLAKLAEGHVWLDTNRDSLATIAWVTSSGEVRHLGDPPASAQLADPTIEDGYLLLTGALQPEAAA